MGTVIRGYFDGSGHSKKPDVEVERKEVSVSADAPKREPEEVLLNLVNHFAGGGKGPEALVRALENSSPTGLVLQVVLAGLPAPVEVEAGDWELCKTKFKELAMYYQTHDTGGMEKTVARNGLLVQSYSLTETVELIACSDKSDWSAKPAFFFALFERMRQEFTKRLGEYKL